MITALHWVNIVLAHKLLHSIENTKDFWFAEEVIGGESRHTDGHSQRRHPQTRTLSKILTGTKSWSFHRLFTDEHSCFIHEQKI